MIVDGLAIPLSLLTIPEVPLRVLTPLQLFTRGQEQGMEVTWEGNADGSYLPESHEPI